MVGGLSAHADQAGLPAWYSKFEHPPPAVLAHEEERSAYDLFWYLKESLDAQIRVARLGETVNLWSDFGSAYGGTGG